MEGYCHEGQDYQSCSATEEEDDILSRDIYEWYPLNTDTQCLQ